MDLGPALAKLKDPSIHGRLEAARYLALYASEKEVEQLRSALAKETVAWVRSALERALLRAEGAETPPDVSVDQGDDFLAQGLYSEAVVEVSAQLLHELEPLVGVLRLRLVAEWRDFVGSKSDLALGKLEDVLDSIRELNAASQVPNLVEVALNDLLPELAAEFGEADPDTISFTGPETTVYSSPLLLQAIVRNALRNAVEATPPERSQPIITWGSAGDEYFITVLDDGLGPPNGVAQAFEIGRTTKSGHLGMGLAIVRRAAQALGGEVVLRRRPEGGAAFEFRGPVRP